MQQMVFFLCAWPADLHSWPSTGRHQSEEQVDGWPVKLVGDLFGVGAVITLQTQAHVCLIT